MFFGFLIELTLFVKDMKTLNLKDFIQITLNEAKRLRDKVGTSCIINLKG